MYVWNWSGSLCSLVLRQFWRERQYNSYIIIYMYVCMYVCMWHIGIIFDFYLGLSHMYVRSLNFVYVHEPLAQSVR